MKVIRIKKTYRRQPDAVFGTSTRGVFSHCKSNATYPLAGPIVIAALPILDKYDEAAQNARVTRDRNWILTRNECRVALTAALDKLVNAAELTTPGNAVQLSTTGFELTGQPKPAPDMPKPEGFTVESTQASGKVICKVPSFDKSISFMFEYIQLPNAENNWTSKSDTKSRVTISGLTPGSQYSFRCAYFGTKGQGAWSDIITRFIS